MTCRFADGWLCLAEHVYGLVERLYFLLIWSTVVRPMAPMRISTMSNPIQLDRSSQGAGLNVGLGGSNEHGCVALSDGQTILGVCEQERITRVRGAGFNATGLPDEALDLLLGRAGRSRRDILRYTVAEDTGRAPLQNSARMDHHQAHAGASYLSSGFTSAVIVVCDNEFPDVSVWQGNGSDLTRIDWPWQGQGFSDLYYRCAHLLVFGAAAEQRFEALARLDPDHRDDRLDSQLKTDGVSLHLEAGWEQRVSDWFLAETSQPGIGKRARQAAALQRRVGELLLTFLVKVRAATHSENLCLAGSLFYHSSINSIVKTSGLFARVFVPVNPGNAGLAVGTALYASGCLPRRLSPFLGPAYTSGEIKATLENCKVDYTWVSETEAVEIAVDALRRGRLVGWYDGAMEWGPRALGARSILANPFAPYVLENLNQFLKNRDPWCGYALSG